MSSVQSDNSLVKGISHTPSSSSSPVNGLGLKVCILSTKWNIEIVSSMKSGAIKVLTDNGVLVEDILEVTVPGAYELPFAAKSIIEKNKSIDAVIALGCLIKGETKHFEYICNATSLSLQEVGLTTGIPIIFGVLTVLNIEQAKARAGLIPNTHNHGIDYGYAAIEMAKLKFKSSKL